MKESVKSWVELSLLDHEKQEGDWSPVLFLCTDFPCESLDRITRLARSIVHVDSCYVTLQDNGKIRVVSTAGADLRPENEYTLSIVIPLVNRQGKQVGALNILDADKSGLNEEETLRLEECAQLIIRELELQAVILNQQRIKEQLQAIKRQHITIVNNIKEVIFQADLQGRWTFLNPAWSTITGFKTEHSLGKLIFSYLPNKDQEIFVEIFLDLVHRKRESYQLEARLATNDSQWKWVEISISPTIDEWQNCIGISGTITDITERKQIEMYLEESKQRYKSLFEQNNDAILAVDISGIFTSANPATSKLTGYSLEELLGRPFYSLIHNQRLGKIGEYFIKTFRGEPQEFETNIIHKDGHQVELNVKTSPIFVNHKIIGAFVVGEDITMKKRADVILKRTMQELADFKLALDESSMVSISDEKGMITYVNENFCEVSSYSREEIIGQHYSVLDSQEVDPEFFPKVDQVINQGIVWKGQIQNVAKDGSLIWAETTIVPFLDEFGSPYQYMTIKQDITARKLAEERFIDELELAKKVQRSILTPPIHNEYLQIDAVYEPSEQLSGDLYSWYMIDEHRYGVIILDVMGHGVPASLVIMSIRALLRGLITRVVEPIQVMDELNQHMCNLFKDEEQPMVTFVTGIYLVIDMKLGTIEYVNAGHPSGLFISNQEITPLDSGGIPLGVLSDIQLNQGKIHFTRDFRVFLYTDGLLDSFDTSSKMNKDIVKQNILDYENRHHSELFQEMLSNKRAQHNAADDICMISITVNNEAFWGEGR
ncbi:PAS domain S-box protein [Brevibacillus ginsengisoli]|uniref:SpoIIE family protein phosphatase n=1 Tax=Brevibacillus ginsengisoli TaxID=363854 RepID=UPI003CF85D9C